MRRMQEFLGFGGTPAWMDEEEAEGWCLEPREFALSLPLGVLFVAALAVALWL